MMPAPVSAYVPQCAPVTRSPKKPFFMWLVAVSGALAVFGLVLLAPFALAHGHPSFALFVYKGFSSVCHQVAERSFYLGGHPYAVCARCFGVYGGFALSITVYPLVRSLNQTSVPARAWLVAAILPTTIDWALGYADLWGNTHLSRAATGAVLGAASVFYVMPGLVELSRVGRRTKRETTSDMIPRRSPNER